MKSNVLDKIDKYILSSYNIDINKDYKIEYIDAKELLVPERIDLIAKIKYIESYENKLKTSFFINLYQETISAFSGDKYVEPGNKCKNSFDKYVKTFNSLIDTIKDNGIDANKSVIPVGDDNIILDGAHRVSIAIYYNLKVPIVRFSGVKQNFDINFFKNRLLEKKYLDYLILEYSKIKDNVYALCLWPRCNSDNITVATDYINNNLKILYNFNINLNYNGLKNLMMQIYQKFAWIGSYKNHHIGVYTKVDQCYIANRPTNIIVAQASSLDEVLKIKNSIRDKINISNHSIHSTDNKEETIQLLELTLNSNSVSALNMYDPDKYNRFNEKFMELKDILAKKKIDYNNILVDSGALMALFGIRENDDLDILVSEKLISSFKDTPIETHNLQLKYYDNSLDDLIFNPENYFIYDSIKFMTLENLIIMKKNRNELKDQDDISLINEKIKVKSLTKLKKIKIFYNTKIRKFKRKSKEFLITILTKIGCLDFFLKIYHKIRGKS